MLGLEDVEDVDPANRFIRADCGFEPTVVSIAGFRSAPLCSLAPWTWRSISFHKFDVEVFMSPGAPRYSGP